MNILLVLNVFFLYSVVCQYQLSDFYGTEWEADEDYWWRAEDGFLKYHSFTVWFYEDSETLANEPGGRVNFWDRTDDWDDNLWIHSYDDTAGMLYLKEKGATTYSVALMFEVHGPFMVIAGCGREFQPGYLPFTFTEADRGCWRPGKNCGGSLGLSQNAHIQVIRLVCAYNCGKFTVPSLLPANWPSGSNPLPQPASAFPRTLLGVWQFTDLPYIAVDPNDDRYPFWCPQAPTPLSGSLSFILASCDQVVVRLAVNQFTLPNGDVAPASAVDYPVHSYDAASGYLLVRKSFADTAPSGCYYFKPDSAGSTNAVYSERLTFGDYACPRPHNIPYNSGAISQPFLLFVPWFRFTGDQYLDVELRHTNTRMQCVQGGCINVNQASTGNCPTPQPTRFPTPRPTGFPTRLPTPWPTLPPTPRPTPPPTFSPTPYPTRNPTPSPTPEPTAMLVYAPPAPAPPPPTPSPTFADGTGFDQLRCTGACTGCSLGGHLVGTSQWCKCCALEDLQGEYYRETPCFGNGCPRSVFQFSGCLSSGFCQPNLSGSLMCGSFGYCSGVINSPAPPPPLPATPSPSPFPTPSPTRYPTISPTPSPTLSPTPSPTVGNPNYNAVLCLAGCSDCGLGSTTPLSASWCRCCANEDTAMQFWLDNPCAGQGCDYLSVFDFNGCRAAGFCQPVLEGSNELGCAEFGYCNGATNAPSPSPTTPQPTNIPTAEPTSVPTKVPTAEPTSVPTKVPTAEPTSVPTKVSTDAPTSSTSAPTNRPTSQPTTDGFTPQPGNTPAPSGEPTGQPTTAVGVTGAPTTAPVAEPTPVATSVPTLPPSGGEATQAPSPALQDDERVVSATDDVEFRLPNDLARINAPAGAFGANVRRARLRARLSAAPFVSDLTQPSPLNGVAVLEVDAWDDETGAAVSTLAKPIILCAAKPVNVALPAVWCLAFDQSSSEDNAATTTPQWSCVDRSAVLNSNNFLCGTTSHLTKFAFVRLPSGGGSSLAPSPASDAPSAAPSSQTDPGSTEPIASPSDAAAETPASSAGANAQQTTAAAVDDVRASDAMLADKPQPSPGGGGGGGGAAAAVIIVLLLLGGGAVGVFLMWRRRQQKSQQQAEQGGSDGSVEMSSTLGDGRAHTSTTEDFSLSSTAAQSSERHDEYGDLPLKPATLPDNDLSTAAELSTEYTMPAPAGRRRNDRKPKITAAGGDTDYQAPPDLTSSQGGSDGSVPQSSGTADTIEFAAGQLSEYDLPARTTSAVAAASGVAPEYDVAPKKSSKKKSPRGKASPRSGGRNQKSHAKGPAASLQEYAAARASEYGAAFTPRGDSSNKNKKSASRADDGISPRSDEWEIDRADLELGMELGRGAFAVVYLGQFAGQPCAVKKLLNDDGVDPEEAEREAAQFRREMRVMRDLPPHKNCVQLIGVCSDESNGPHFLIVTEFCAGGALNGYLRAQPKNSLPTRQRLAMALDAARGILHLHQNAIIHRDLACRNLLLSGDGVIKVADFGLARDMTESGNKTKSRVGPLRWMAVESLNSQLFSVKSDAWAFAVCVWEIETQGELPFKELSPMEVALQVARDGRTLDKPPRTSPQLYELMQECWQQEPTDRPSFREIVKRLKDLLEYAKGNATPDNSGGKLPPIRNAPKASSRGSKARARVAALSGDDSAGKVASALAQPTDAATRDRTSSKKGKGKSGKGKGKSSSSATTTSNTTGKQALSAEEKAARRARKEKKEKKAAAAKEKKSKTIVEEMEAMKEMNDPNIV